MAHKKNARNTKKSPKAGGALTVNSGPKKRRVKSCDQNAQIALYIGKQAKATKRIQCATWVIAIATVFSLIVAAVMAGIAYYQWGQLKTTNEVAKDQATTAHDALITGHRAYVYARPGNVYNVSDGKIPEPRIVIGNSGQTLAKNVKRWARAIISPTLTRDEIQNLTRGEPEPGAPIAIPRIQHGVIRYSQKLAPGDQEEISARNAKKRLYVFGRVEYLDIFEKPHFTDFCFVYFGEQMIWRNNGGAGYASNQARYCDARNDAN